MLRHMSVKSVTYDMMISRVANTMLTHSNITSIMLALTQTVVSYNFNILSQVCTHYMHIDKS